LLRHSGMLRTVNRAASTSRKRSSALPCLLMSPAVADLGWNLPTVHVLIVEIADRILSAPEVPRT
jgi:hypothetical protein